MVVGGVGRLWSGLVPERTYAAGHAVTSAPHVRPHACLQILSGWPNVLAIGEKTDAATAGQAARYVVFFLGFHVGPFCTWGAFRRMQWGQGAALLPRAVRCSQIGGQASPPGPAS